MGLSYLPLAQIGLEALDWWSQSLPAEDIAPYYVDILPCLDAYLKTSDKGGRLASVMQYCTSLSCLSYGNCDRSDDWLSVSVLQVLA